MINKTGEQFDRVVNKCRTIFEKKLKDYGTAWRIMRASSVTDQLFIKAQRIRTLQEKGTSKVDEGIEPEFIGLLNYSVIGLIQLEKGAVEEVDMSEKDALVSYDEQVAKAKRLMEDKNHDYGEAWRDMRISSLTDMILMKINRTKQIEDNEGNTLISEGIDANYLDIFNYANFALIKLLEEHESVGLDS